MVDLEAMRVSSEGRSIQLTLREWTVLRVLISQAGRVISSRQVLREAWGPEYGDETDYVRSYVSRLRTKLEPEPSRPRHILLERGLGYRLVEPD